MDVEHTFNGPIDTGGSILLAVGIFFLVRFILETFA